MKEGKEEQVFKDETRYSVWETSNDAACAASSGDAQKPRVLVPDVSESAMWMCLPPPLASESLGWRDRACSSLSPVTWRIRDAQ